MLNNKRSRALADKSIEFVRKPNSEELQELHKVVFSTEKTLCEFCQKDITFSVKVACAVCPKTIYCLECLISHRGKEEKSIHKHDFHMIDKLTMPLFMSDWSSKEEICLLVGNFHNFLSYKTINYT